MDEHPVVQMVRSKQVMSVSKMLMLMAHKDMRLNTVIPTREACLLFEEQKDES